MGSDGGVFDITIFDEDGTPDIPLYHDTENKDFACSLELTGGKTYVVRAKYLFINEDNKTSLTVTVSREIPGEIATVRLVLQNDMTVNFYAVFETEPTQPALAVTMNGTTTNLEGVPQETGDASFKYKFSYTGVNPQCMGDAMTAVLTYRLALSTSFFRRPCA